MRRCLFLLLPFTPLQHRALARCIHISAELDNEGAAHGLTLLHDMVVKGHGGSIQVESVEREGSEFIITLPIN